MAGYWEIIIPEATTNVVYNPSAELTGNYSAVGGATISIISTRQSYGAKAYYLQTGGSNQGVQLTTATMANAIHYLTFRSSDSDYTWPTITTTVDGANFNVPAVLSTDNGYSLYGVQIPAAQCNGATYVRIVQGSAGASKQAVIDGIQIEQKEYRTTYVDGDQPGCKWNGTPHASTSTRDQFEAGGGRVYNLRDDLGFIVNAQDGTGMPPVTNLSSPLALQPGNLFDGQTIQGRSFSLTGSIIGSTVANFHSQKQALIKALNVNTTTIGKRGQPRIFRYTGAAEEKEIYAVYDGGLEFGLPIGWTEKEFTLRVLADDPFFYGAGEKAAALDTNDSATFNGWGGRVNGQWSNLDGPAMTGTGGWVIARSHGKFVLGGNFTNFDGIAEADYIVNYDGSAYSALGSGFDGAVTALIVGADGSLYAGGGFTGSGATTLRGIGKWNGTAWAALGPPSSGGSVYTLLFDSSGNLWVGGDFTNWDGIANADYLVKWNGTAWSAIGTGANGVVWSLAQDASGTIYAAGSFTTINSVSCNRVAKWTGTTWATLGTGLDSTAYSMAIDDGGRVFVGGNHTTSGGVATNYISVWNGGAWEPLGDGLSGDVRGLAISPDGEVYAAGYFTNVSSTTYGVSAAIWNGSVWYPPDHISASASSTGRGFFWYGGDFYYAFYWGGTFNHSGKITISYTGTERAYPYIKIKRSGGTSASLQNITNAITKAQLLFNYSLANGEEVTITTTPGKQSIVSSLRGDINNELLPNSDFGNFYLTPGNAAAAQDNIITAFVDTAGSPTITASIIYRNVYISED